LEIPRFDSGNVMVRYRTRCSEVDSRHSVLKTLGVFSMDVGTVGSGPSPSVPGAKLTSTASPARFCIVGRTGSRCVGATDGESLLDYTD
jgi:hypothetical protein